MPAGRPVEPIPLTEEEKTELDERRHQSGTAPRIGSAGTDQACLWGWRNERLHRAASASEPGQGREVAEALPPARR